MSEPSKLALLIWLSVSGGDNQHEDLGQRKTGVLLEAVYYILDRWNSMNGTHSWNMMCMDMSNKCGAQDLLFFNVASDISAFCWYVFDILIFIYKNIYKSNLHKS